MKNVLIVDDEKAFLLSLSEGLSQYSGQYTVFTAENGEAAIKILSAQHLDLVITDLKMDQMDGLQLLAVMNNQYPTIPTIVMTAFGTPEIEEKINKLGAVQYLEKPLTINQLADKIDECLQAGKKGYISRINISSFVQILEIEGKTCTLTIKNAGNTGMLFFNQGKLIDAKTGTLQGKNAALEIIGWETSEIAIHDICNRREKVINESLEHIVFKASILSDERKKNVIKQDTKNLESDVRDSQPQTVHLTEETVMSIKEKLQQFSSLEGFAGVGLFTPTGEALTMLAEQTSEVNLQKVGVLANNVLMNAQKASLEMGTGRGQLVHIVAEKAHILVRCLNEGNDPIKSEPGKAHIHLVLILKDDSSIGLAKMKVNSIIEDVAPQLRN